MNSLDYFFKNYTSEEAAKILKISRTTFRRLRDFVYSDPMLDVNSNTINPGESSTTGLTYIKEIEDKLFNMLKNDPQNPNIEYYKLIYVNFNLSKHKT